MLTSLLRLLFFPIDILMQKVLVIFSLILHFCIFSVAYLPAVNLQSSYLYLWSSEAYRQDDPEFAEKARQSSGRLERSRQSHTAGG